MKPRAAFFPGVRLPISVPAQGPGAVQGPRRSQRSPGQAGKFGKARASPQRDSGPSSPPGESVPRHRFTPALSRSGTGGAPAPVKRLALGQSTSRVCPRPGGRSPPRSAESADREGPGPQESQALEEKRRLLPWRPKFRNRAAPAFQQALKEAVASRQKSQFPPGIRPGAPSAAPTG